MNSHHSCLPLPLPPLASVADIKQKIAMNATDDMHICYKCSEPTIGGVYCSCPEHLPSGGLYANKYLIEAYPIRRLCWYLNK